MHLSIFYFTFKMPAFTKHKTQRLLRKTQLCSAFQETGECAYGAKCHFAHSQDELQDKPDLTATSLCKYFAKKGTCSAGSECKFAHQTVEAFKASKSEAAVVAANDDDLKQSIALEINSAIVSYDTQTNHNNGVWRLPAEMEAPAADVVKRFSRKYRL